MDILKYSSKLTMGLISICLLTLTLITHTQNLEAQEIPQYNRWSVDVGVSNFMGKKSDAWSPFTGQLDVESGSFTPGFHSNLRYFFSPAFSLQLGLDYLKLSDDGEDPMGRTFENSITNLTMRANVQLRPLFQLGHEKWSQNLHFGFGRAYGSISDVPGSADADVEAGNYFFGFGLKRKLSDRVDLYSEYSYHVFTKSGMDGFEFDSDRLGKLTFGVSFKLGNTSAKPHAEWYPSNTALYATNERLDRTNAMILEYERKLAEQERKINSLQSDVQTVNENDCCGNVQMLKSQVQKLSSEVDSLKSQITEPRRPMVTSGFYDTPPPGYYVQVFADYTLQRAEYAMQLTKDHFANNNTGNHNFIISKTPTGTWFIVLVGPYDGYSLTSDILSTAKTLFDDSYVEMFPKNR